MLEGLESPLAARAGGDIAAVAGDRLFDLGNGVRGAGDHPGDVGMEHGGIVVVVAGGENPVGWKPELFCKFGQSQAFVVGAVAKPQVDRVSFVGEVFDICYPLIEECADGIHFGNIVGDDAGGFLWGIEVAG